MAFDLTPQGNIASLHLWGWEAAIVADEACLLRLILARHADEPEKDTVAVQLTLSPSQAESIAQVLQNMVQKISDARRSTPMH